MWHTERSQLFVFISFSPQSVQGPLQSAWDMKIKLSHTQGKMVLMPLVPSVCNVKEGPYDKYS